MSVPHPGPARRLGKAQGSLLFKPCGSPSVPNVAVNGTPSLALKIAPSSHPFTKRLAGPDSDLRPGTSHVPLSTSVRPTLKSDTARSSLRSNQCKLGIEFPNVSPATTPELSSMLLLHVKDP